LRAVAPVPSDAAKGLALSFTAPVRVYRSLKPLPTFFAGPFPKKKTFWKPIMNMMAEPLFAQTML